jgi:hypothetical protein
MGLNWLQENKIAIGIIDLIIPIPIQSNRIELNAFRIFDQEAIRELVKRTGGIDLQRCGSFKKAVPTLKLGIN